MAPYDLPEQVEIAFRQAGLNPEDFTYLGTPSYHHFTGKKKEPYVLHVSQIHQPCWRDTAGQLAITTKFYETLNKEVDWRDLMICGPEKVELWVGNERQNCMVDFTGGESFGLTKLVNSPLVAFGVTDISLASRIIAGLQKIQSQYGAKKSE